jgi:hypothetical protein
MHRPIGPVAGLALMLLAVGALAGVALLGDRRPADAKDQAVQLDRRDGVGRTGGMATVLETTWSGEWSAVRVIRPDGSPAPCETPREGPVRPGDRILCLPAQEGQEADEAFDGPFLVVDDRGRLLAEIAFHGAGATS